VRLFCKDLIEDLLISVSNAYLGRKSSIPMLPTWLQSDRNKIILGILIVFSVISGYVYQFPFFQNCINIKAHIIAYILIAGVMGITIGYLFGKPLHFLIEKVQLMVGLAIVTMILLPLLLTLINRFVPRNSPIMTEVTIQRIDEYSQSRFGELELSKTVDGVYIYFILDKQPFRLDAAPDFDELIYPKGSSLPINIHQGIFGLKWVSLRTE